jgi:NADH:ubiquinone oxidoreductase subunit 5 (subunit L)/multisubunit Na+/H+ antiporter MnhA subunit
LKEWLSAPSIGSVTSLVSETGSGLPVELLEKISAAAAIAGILLGIFFYRKWIPDTVGRLTPIYQWIGNQFGYDKAMVSASVDGGREIATLLDDNVDRGLIAGSGIGLGRLSEAIQAVLNKLQSGLVRVYALSMLVGVIGIAILVTVLNMGGHK